MHATGLTHAYNEAIDSVPMEYRKNMPPTGHNANPSIVPINNLPNVIPTKLKASVVQAQLLTM
jgi:hypothetical protein